MTVVGGARLRSTAAIDDRTLLPPGLAPKRGTPNDMASGQVLTSLCGGAELESGAKLSAGGGGVLDGESGQSGGSTLPMREDKLPEIVEHGLDGLWNME